MVAILAFITCPAYAEISINRKSPKPQVKVTQPSDQLHIDGYVDGQYVRLIVDILPDNNLVGYLFEGKEKTYLYGQKQQGALHMYTPDGRHITITPSQ